MIEKFQPVRLEIFDDSGRHAGHAGAQPGGETHYRIIVLSPVFSGKPRIERHRLVNDVLKEEFESGLHAVQLDLKAPEEAG